MARDKRAPALNPAQASWSRVEPLGPSRRRSDAEKCGAQQDARSALCGAGAVPEPCPSWPAGPRFQGREHTQISLPLLVEQSSSLM